MATAPLQEMQLVRSAVGELRLSSALEAATQTFKKGELVYLASGYLTECSDNPSLIAGIAAEDGHNDSSAGTHTVTYVPIVPGDILEANTTTLTTATNVGTVYDLYRDTTNSKAQVLLTTSNPRVIIVKLSPRDTVGDTYGRVYISFVSKYLQFAGCNV
jgi:hypothetical protein